MYNKTETVPKPFAKYMSDEQFKKFKKYGLQKSKFTIFQTVVELIITYYTLQYNGIHQLWKYLNMISTNYFKNNILISNREYFLNSIFLIIINSMIWIISIPFKYYKLYNIEIQFGFKKYLTLSKFIINCVKSLIISLIVSIIIQFINVLINGQPPYIVLPLTMSAIKIISYLMAPLFYHNKRPLEDGELKEKIQELAKVTNFPLKKIYIVSYASSKSDTNCKIHYCIRNIYIFKNLLQKKEMNKNNRIEKGFDNDEVVALVAHEIGSWKKSQDFIKLLLSHLQFVAIGVLMRYFTERHDLLAAFGFDEYEIMPLYVAGYIVIQFVLLPFSSIMVFFMNLYSHCCVFQADKFVKDMGYQKKLSKAIIKLNVENARFPKYDMLYSKFYKSQPTILQRLKRLAVKKDE